MMIGGAVCLLLFWWHAARVEHAILDLDLLKIQTFTASVIGGSFMRMGIGATPFLVGAAAAGGVRAFGSAGRIDDVRQRRRRADHEDGRSANTRESLVSAPQ